MTTLEEAPSPSLPIRRRSLNPLTKRFDEIGIEDIPLVGGKNASLGEMRRELSGQGVPVPDGFATTAAAYWHFLEATGLKSFIKKSLGALDVTNIDELQKCSAKIRAAILAAELPYSLRQQIHAGYEQLCARAGEVVAVAVRSSATAEDPDSVLKTTVAILETEHRIQGGNLK